MNLNNIEKRFGSYLDKFWNLSDIAPFLCVYIRLLLLFQKELSPVELAVVLQRQKQLRGEEFRDDDFGEVISSSRKKMNLNIRNNTDMTREAMLNRLLFCALLDTEESDFFYLTEPIFEFVRKMEVSPNQLNQILELEFVGFGSYNQ